MKTAAINLSEKLHEGLASFAAAVDASRSSVVRLALELQFGELLYATPAQLAELEHALEPIREALFQMKWATDRRFAGRRKPRKPSAAAQQLDLTL